MIIRVTKARIHAGMEGEAFELMRSMAAAALLPGLEAFELGRRVVDGRLELHATTTWSDYGAMRAAMGADSESALFSPRLSQYVETASVDHYELVAESLHGFVALDPTITDLLESSHVDAIGVRPEA